MSIVFWIILFSIFLLLLLIGTYAVFGRLIFLQFKRWTLASRGYVEFEHVSPTNVRNYFIMKPIDNKFDVHNGFYHFIPECVTRKGQIIKKYDAEFLKKEKCEIDPVELEGLSDKEQKAYIKKREVEFEEMKKIVKVLGNQKYDPEMLSRKMGMPVITYYGDNPDPVNFADRKKVYGAGVIKDMYLRLLLTQRYKDFKMFVLICTIAIVIIAISNVGFYYNGKSLIANNGKCLAQLQSCHDVCNAWINETFHSLAQGSTQVIQ